MITPILEDAISWGSLVTCSQSVTLAQNDVLVFAFTFRKTGSATFPTWTWNGTPCTMIADINDRDARTVIGYIKAPVSATGSLVSAASPTQSQGNLMLHVARSDSNSFLSNPVKVFGTSELDTETPWVAPSIPITGLVAGDMVVSFLNFLGWDSSFGNITSVTATPNSPLTLSDSVQNSVNPGSPGRAYLSKTTGLTGSQTFSYTKVGTGNNMYTNAIVVLYESLFLIDTLTSPLVPNAAFSGTCTGYADGAATLSFSGVSISVTIASGAFSGTIPMIADNTAWPRLPATGRTITLTQGANSATILRDISLPSGYDTTRNEASNPANFFAVVTDHDQFLGAHFLAAGNPLTTSQSWMFVASGGRKVYQDSSVEADESSLPRTDIDFKYDDSLGKYFEHSVTMTAAGVVIDPVHLNALKVATQYNIINNSTYAVGAGNSVFCSYVPHKIGGSDVTHLALVFEAWCLPNTSTGLLTDLNANYTVESAVIEYNGATAQLTFGGSVTKALVSGDSNIRTDELDVFAAFGVESIPYDATVYVKTRLSLSGATLRIPIATQRTSDVTPGIQFLRCTPSSTVGSDTAIGPWGTTGTASNPTGYTPGVVGRHTIPNAVAVMAHGDSLTQGVGDSGPSASGHSWIGRALDSMTVTPAFWNFGVSGCTILAGVTDPRLLPYYGYANVGFSNAATNDFGTGAVISVATAINRHNTLIARMKNQGIKKVGVMALLPRTTSGDGFATLAGQTLYGTWGAGGNPATYNTTIESSGFDFVIQQDSVRDLTDQYKWISDGVANKYTTDGTHGAQASYLLMAAEAKPVIESAITAALIPNAYTSTGTGNWNDSTKWTPAGVPTELDSVTIAAGHTITVPSWYIAKHAGLTLNGTVVITGKLECHGNIIVNIGGVITGSPTLNGYAMTGAGVIVGVARGIIGALVKSLKFGSAKLKSSRI